MSRRSDALTAVGLLNEACRLQAEAIDILFSLLAQHITAEEAGNLEALPSIEKAAKIMEQF